MNTLRQAAQAAEDFLDRRWRKTGACDDDIREHAEALRAALAEPQPEPVLPPQIPNDYARFLTPSALWEMYVSDDPAAPQTQQHDCERRPYGDLRNAKWLDPECYAKGACQSLIFKQAQQPQPEPYCYIYEYDSVLGLHREFYPRQWNGYLPSRAVPLYATPQPELSSSELGNVKQPLKERPDFIAGYTAGLADGKACAERDAEPFNAKADRLRIAGVTLIGLAEHDHHCDVFNFDDDGRHMACSCGLNESVKIIAEAAHWTRGE